MTGTDLPLNKRYGDHILRRLIARGGMAEVYLAQLQDAGGFKRDVVIKQVLPQFVGNHDFTRMLLEEARIAARLLHPNIAQVLNCGVHEDAPYLVLEYVRGQSLRGLIRRLNKRGEVLSFDECMYVLVNVLAALHHAHNQTDDDGQPMQIIHRDVTPENILLSYNGEVKLTDFGVARAAGRTEQTQTGVVKGKLAYMAPEQFKHQPIDHRLDQYALALSACEMLSGQQVFKAGNEAQVINLLLDGAEARLKGRPDIVQWLGAAHQPLMRALQARPEDRFESSAEMRSALTALISPRALSEAHDSLTARLNDAFAAELAAERPQERDTQPSVTDVPTRHHGEVRTAENPTVVETTPTIGEPPWRPRARLAAAVAIVVLSVPLLWQWVFSPLTAGPSQRGTPKLPAGVKVLAPQSDTPTHVDAPAASAAAPNAVDPPPESSRLPRRRTEANTPHRAGAAAAAHVEPKAPPQASLDIACLPWCEISLNGQPTHRNSPVRAMHVPAGEYDVQVVNPPSGHAETRHVTVRPGESLRLQFRL